ncbi:hypothetical protein LTR94_029242, partial [Friedmanniomyces endolithicus]
MAGAACAQEQRTYQIPPGALGEALFAWGAQSDQQIFFTSELVAGRRSPGASGAFTPDAALDAVLQGTGLTWSRGSSGAVVLRIQREELSALQATDIGDVIVTGSLLRTPGTATSPLVTLDRDALDRRGQGTVADVLANLPQNFSGS